MVVSLSDFAQDDAFFGELAVKGSSKQAYREDDIRGEFALILFDTKLNDEICDVIKYYKAPEDSSSVEQWRHDAPKKILIDDKKNPSKLINAFYLD